MKKEGVLDEFRSLFSFQGLGQSAYNGVAFSDAGH